MNLSDFPSGWNKACGPVVQFGYAALRIRCGHDLLLIDMSVLNSGCRRILYRLDYDEAVWRAITSSVTSLAWDYDTNFVSYKEVERLSCYSLVTAEGVEFYVMTNTPYTKYRQYEDRLEPRHLMLSLWRKG